MGLLNFLFPFFGTLKKRPDATHSTGRADESFPMTWMMISAIM